MRVSDLEEWSSTLVAYLSGHIDTERDALETYQTLERTHSSKLVGYLVDSIIADETRHHQLFIEMKAAIETGLVDPTASSLAHLGDGGSGDPVLLATTDRLLDIEREDLHELAELRHRLDAVADTRRWIPLVEMMELDTKKHITMLSFIRELS